MKLKYRVTIFISDIEFSHRLLVIDSPLVSDIDDLLNFYKVMSWTETCGYHIKESEKMAKDFKVFDQCHVSPLDYRNGEYIPVGKFKEFTIKTLKEYKFNLRLLTRA